MSTSMWLPARVCSIIIVTTIHLAHCFNLRIFRLSFQSFSQGRWRRVSGRSSQWNTIRFTEGNRLLPTLYSRHCAGPRYLRNDKKRMQVTRFGASFLLGDPRGLTAWNICESFIKRTSKWHWSSEEEELAQDSTTYREFHLQHLI